MASALRAPRARALLTSRGPRRRRAPRPPATVVARRPPPLSEPGHPSGGVHDARRRPPTSTHAAPCLRVAEPRDGCRRRAGSRDVRPPGPRLTHPGKESFDAVPSAIRWRAGPRAASTRAGVPLSSAPRSRRTDRIRAQRRAQRRADRCCRVLPAPCRRARRGVRRGLSFDAPPASRLARPLARHAREHVGFAPGRLRARVSHPRHDRPDRRAQPPQRRSDAEPRRCAADAASVSGRRRPGYAASRSPHRRRGGPLLQLPRSRRGGPLDAGRPPKTATRAITASMVGPPAGPAADG